MCAIWWECEGAGEAVACMYASVSLDDGAPRIFGNRATVGVGVAEPKRRCGDAGRGRGANANANMIGS
jgi:hypothetical protein